jgi:hypothetical protein
MVPPPLYERRQECLTSDGTIDNRWRPDLESSQRRVREAAESPSA